MQLEQKHSFTAHTYFTASRDSSQIRARVKRRAEWQERQHGCMEYEDAEKLEQPERKHSFTADTHGCMEHEDADSAERQR